ncbi:bromodomain adjacent to zinc finger domain protein 1A [Genypterus blacodes]|uniref:bromodomain adjacent to zinc finger domain protein 1A n=1 Tax=Genypterus blacodes TaxID=154954 RepID=UPI003F76687D
MPLLHRRAFIRQRPPADLRPDEEVFLCKITHEVFRSYDEFFERTILCNSLVWSCALTGRAGLTYLEALESERRAQQSLKSFPSALVVPLLHLVALSRRCRLTELCDDIYAFAKDRYFPGESVEVATRNGARHVCEILQVHSPRASANGTPSAKGHLKPADDTIVISDSDDESRAFQTPPAHINGKKRKPLSPSLFKYSVKMMDDCSELLTIKANQISRKKNILSRERLKLLLKQHCEPHNGTIALKASTVVKYGLAEQTFSQFFPDEPPLFPFSPKGAGRVSPAQAKSSLLKAAEDRLKLLKEEMAGVTKEKAQLKKEREEVQEAKRKEKEDKEKLKEEQRRRFEEEKQRKREEKEHRKLEKEQEREKLKEEKKKYAERLKLWNKPREDMECEDLKDLPRPTAVQTRLPAQLFGAALMVLEFLRAFGEVFDLKDEFPEGVSLEVLEEALVGSDPEGPLCELLFFFLSAIFQALDEEQEEVAREQADCDTHAHNLSEALDDDSDPTQSALSAVASLAAAWPQLHQGCSLKQLDLDSCTLSEILRLHILASGADCNHGNAKFRYQKQGGFTPTDDPCVELRLAEPTLLKRLACTAVYDLTPGEKLQVLQALMGKLLTLASSRDLVEDCMEDQRAARQELREVRAEQHRRGREEAAYRVRLRKEEKLREQEQKMKEKEEKLREQEMKSGDQINSETPVPAQLSPKEPQTMSCPPSSLTAEEQEEEQDKVRELQERIQKAASCTSLLPLGRDRLYRRYWLLPSASALFVEEDSFGLTEDMLRPCPRPTHDSKMEMDDKEEEASGEGSAPLDADAQQVNRPNQWSFFSSMEEVDQLIEALNPRGHRESSLKEALLQERERLALLLQQSLNTYSIAGSSQSTSCAEPLMEVRLRDLLLDIEDRIHQGTLGTLKVMDRKAWRSALEAGNYELLCSDGRENGGMNGRLDALMDSAHLRARDRSDGPSGSVTPQVVSSSMGGLAQALAHIEQGLERRFLKAPLGEEEPKKEKMKKNKKKEADEDQTSEDGSDSGRGVKSVLDRWRESLLSCSSLSQAFVHLSTLERSILWSRSVLNARCRICRRKGDADNMLLCDGCDRGHHTHCLRPRLKSIPEGDWFCPDCRPKQRSNRLPSRQRASINEEEEDDSEEQEEESEGEEEEEEEEESDEEEEEEEEVVVSTKKSQAPPTKGKAQQATPKSQQATPRHGVSSSGRSSSAVRSSGKKATPPSTKASTVSGSKAAPRAGSRNSARLSLGILAPNTKLSPGQSSALRKPLTEVTPPPKLSKPVLAPASSSSSSRRSSGRNRGVHELSACEQLTVELVRHQDSWPFMKLVSRTQVPDYYDIIEKPMALSTIREKVNNCDYQTAVDYISDVELMFSNCLRYNPRHTNEAKAGQRLQSFFYSELSRLGLSERSGSPPAKRSRL